MSVRICAEAFDPFAEIRAHQDALGARQCSIGALASFIGSMRDFNEGEAVEAMVKGSESNEASARSRAQSPPSCFSRGFNLATLMSSTLTP